MKNPAEFREVIQFDPDSSLDYNNLVVSYLHLNRLEEARATAEEADAKNSMFLEVFTCLAFCKTMRLR